MIAFKIKNQNKDKKMYLSKREAENIIDKDDVVTEFKEKAEKLGYKIRDPYFLTSETTENNPINCQLIITQKNDNDYLPSLVLVSKDECKIKFQSGFHGFLTEDEMFKFIDAQKVGIEMAKLIKEYYNKLPSIIITDIC